MRLYIKIQDQQIIRMLRQGKRPKEIAEKFNITVWSVYNTVRRTGFGNITNLLAEK